MTIEDFKDSFKYFTIAYLQGGWKNSFIEKRASVSSRLYKFNFTISEKDYNPTGHCSGAPKSVTNLMLAERFDQAIDDYELLDSNDDMEMLELEGDGPYVSD